MNFDKYLFNFSIGPVQPFIAAARRTRDLWFGSQLLSELSFIAAKTISKTGGELIFPHPDILQSKPNSEINVANVILAEIPGSGATPLQIAEKTEKAVKEEWKGYAEKVFANYGKIIDQEIWDSQINDALEFFAAWVPVHNNNYKAARERLNEVMAARKNCRDFNQPSLNAGKRYLEKSPLDGRNETVLKANNGKNFDPEKLPKEIQYQLRLKKNEFLDAIGMIKRGSEIKQFPSVDRIAADPWVRQTVKSSNSAKKLEEIKQICTNSTQVIKVESRAYEAFPFEGSVLYLNRHQNIKEDLKKDTDLDLESIAKVLESLSKNIGIPNPYLAIIKADGDRVGKAISGMKEKEELQKFSSDLARFASKAKEIIENSHGTCIYAGGDDVLAFLPIDTCLSCARNLRNEFNNCMSSEKTSPTLSVGVAIGHFLEPMETLLYFADVAEKKAKKGENQKDERNGIAVIVQSRGNAPIEVREQWQDGDSSLDKRIAFWGNMFRDGSLPSNFPYDLRVMEKSYRNWRDDTKPSAALKADILRLFSKKQATTTHNKDEIAKIIEGSVCSIWDLEKLVNEMLIAKHLANAIPTGKREDGEHK
jgi:CRISPR-associated protein Cmr2